MLHTLTDNELRNLCREKLESLEHWLRRLIDETLSDKYDDYFSYVDDAGSRLIRNSTVKSLDERVRKEPERYKRKIDAVLLDDAIDIICNPRLYKEFFRPAFENAFPEGEDEARTFLKRLLDPRNRLAHANSRLWLSSQKSQRRTSMLLESWRHFNCRGRGRPSF